MAPSLLSDAPKRPRGLACRRGAKAPTRPRFRHPCAQTAHEMQNVGSKRGRRRRLPRRSVEHATLPPADLREGRRMTESSPLTPLLRLVARQYGTFHRHQARDLGVSDSRLHGLARAGRIQRVLPAVFRDVAVPTSLAQRVKAAELWAGPEGCLCGISAAAWWGFDGIRPNGIEIFSPKRLRSTTGITIRKASDLCDADTLVRRGLRVTTIERTLCDLAGRVPHQHLEGALHDVLRRQMTTAP